MNFDLNELKEFPVTIFGELEEINPIQSIARVRIFYKGLNRNGSYITDEFAEQLISSLAYAPVKGIYDEDAEDFTNHGEERTEGRVFGVIMSQKDQDFAWESHLDEDGVTREYACANVLLWTALYEEAKKIPGKSQSMELYEPSIEGNLKLIDGKRVFEFTKGYFLGAQVLGDEVEPCFEGASFYSLYTSMKELIDEFKHYSLSNSQDLNEGGQTAMPELNFKLSDSQKANAIWSLLNPNFNEEGNWEVLYNVIDVYDEFAICYDCGKRKFVKVPYTKNDETDTVELGEAVEVYEMFLTEQEATALNALRALNGDTFELVDQNFVAKAEFENQALKIEDCETEIATLNTEKEGLQAQFTAANESIASLQTELEGLKEFKLQVETQNKQAVIDRYAELLDEEIIAQYSAKIAEYTVDALEKDLAFELVKSNPSVFSKEPQQSYVPEPLQEPSGLEAILAKYKK